jgi:hypothetical protein
LEELLSKREFKTTIIYHEGDRKDIEMGRPDIFTIAEKYKAQIIPLDEGNSSYESYKNYLDSLFSSLKKAIKEDGGLYFNKK